MTEKQEFNLSNEDALWYKGISFNIQKEDFPVYREKDVKEFIKRLKDKFDKNNWENHTLDVPENRNPIIDALAGKELLE